VTKKQGGPPKNAGPAAVASSMPAVMIDSPAVPGVVVPPEDDDGIVADRGSERRRTGRKSSTEWEHLFCLPDQ
jgi:hypothetical protein